VSHSDIIYVTRMWIEKIYVLLAQFAALSLDQDFYSPNK